MDIHHKDIANKLGIKYVESYLNESNRLTIFNEDTEYMLSFINDPIFGSVVTIMVDNHVYPFICDIVKHTTIIDDWNKLMLREIDKRNNIELLQNKI